MNEIIRVYWKYAAYSLIRNLFSGVAKVCRKLSAPSKKDAVAKKTIIPEESVLG